MLAERQHDEARAALNIRRVHVERQKSSASVLAQEKSDRGADSGVGETGQRLSCCDNVPNAANVRKRNQKRGFALGATKRRHEIGLMLVASREERLNERVERIGGRTLEQPDEPRRVFLNERPEIRRMIRDAEKDIAGAAAFEFARELRGRRRLEERSEATACFGRRGEPRRIDEALSERCGHSRPGRRGPAIEAGRPPPAK